MFVGGRAGKAEESFGEAIGHDAFRALAKNWWMRYSNRACHLAAIVRYEDWLRSPLTEDDWETAVNRFLWKWRGKRSGQAYLDLRKKVRGVMTEKWCRRVVGRLRVDGIESWRKMAEEEETRLRSGDFSIHMVYWPTAASLGVDMKIIRPREERMLNAMWCGAVLGDKEIKDD